ncbi:hypothetical protein FOL47_007394 [Perkinsus chesapeaki]|uniref:Major facilitator superfamily (MFS) profile domain-containing protein n=1 Tax=Perkinsus chesapeaki TaxID=330153 RepID=A0A7J6LKV0_PERCH|nr:hypothetical protein FOL47_007394 [Perkinsus chesapeaki]
MVAPLTPWLIADLAPTMNEGAAAAILMSSYIAGTFVSSLISGPLSDRIGRRPVFIGGLIIYTTSFFLVANAWNIDSFASFRALSGLATGLRPVMIAYLSETSLHDDMPFYGMIMSTVVSLGVSLGPVVVLWHFGSFGHRFMYLG